MNDDVPILEAATDWVVTVFSDFVLYEVEVMTVWHGFCETIVVMVVVTTAPGCTVTAMPLVAICELLLLFCAENVHNMVKWTYFYATFSLFICAYVWHN